MGMSTRTAQPPSKNLVGDLWSPQHNSEVGFSDGPRMAEMEVWPGGSALEENTF